MRQQLNSADCEMYIGHQIRLEYQLDEAGRLHPFPSSSEQAYFIIYRYAAGYIKYFRCDLPSAAVSQIEALPPQQAFEDRDAVCAILDAHLPGSGKGGVGGDVFRSCVFVALPSPSEFPDVVCDEKGCFVVEVGGKPVSRAWSSRENEVSAELAVETEEHHRRQGLGRQVAAAWAYDKIKAGKVAFYSYEVHNVASESLARSLGVVEYALVTAYE